MKWKKLCPKCRSASVSLFIGNITGNYQCNKCGFIGPLFMEEADKSF